MRLRLPQKLCHMMAAHKWKWPRTNKAPVAATCERCDMTGARYWQLLKKGKK